MTSGPTPKALIRVVRSVAKPSRRRSRNATPRTLLTLAVLMGLTLWVGSGSLLSLVDSLRSDRPSQPVAQSETVARVIDGDTVELADGSIVRLAGIDTPERGECGYDEATQFMIEQVEGKRVEVVLTDEDTDRYGRMLAYLDLGDGTDTGLAQITAGLAIARYDSRDGYGPHPRQITYVRADQSAEDLCS